MNADPAARRQAPRVSEPFITLAAAPGRSRASHRQDESQASQADRQESGSAAATAHFGHKVPLQAYSFVVILLKIDIKNLALEYAMNNPAETSAGSDKVSGEIATLMGWFFLRYLGRIYREFEGDFVLVMVLGEIAHHNICHFFSLGKPRKNHQNPADSIALDMNRLEPCNAFSLSEATGIPRETIRRKIDLLLQQQLICKHPKGGYVIQPHISEHFSTFNAQLLEDFLATSEDLKNLLTR